MDFYGADIFFNKPWARICDERSGLVLNLSSFVVFFKATVADRKKKKDIKALGRTSLTH